VKVCFRLPTISPDSTTLIITLILVTPVISRIACSNSSIELSITALALSTLIRKVSRLEVLLNVLTLQREAILRNGGQI